MNNQKIFFVIMLVFLLITLPVGVFFIRDLVEVYGFNIIGLPENYIANLFLNKDTYIKFVTVVDPPNILGWTIFGIYLFNSLIGTFGFLKIKKKYEQVEEYGSHGTAKWQTDKEIKDNYYKDDLGWFLGSLDKGVNYKIGMESAYHPVNGELNMQINVVGAPGAKKTTGFIYPNIFHIPYAYKNARQEMPDLVITDPKSEIYSLTSEYLEKEGYEVKVLDFIHLKYGDSLNVHDFISEDKELMEIASAYINSLSSSKEKGDFWAKASTLLLASLIGFVKQVYPPHLQNFTTVAELQSSDDISDENKAINLFKKHGVTGTPLSLYKKYLLAKEKTKDNILISLATDLTLFSIGGIQSVTNSTTVDIGKLGAKKEKPIALFIFMPDGDNTFSPIINVVVSSILNQLYKTAYKYKNKLYVPVYMLIDEIANIGKISGLKEKLGTMRGRRIYPMMIWQDLVQMKDMYGDSWETIVAKCDTQVYLGVNDKFTASYVSDNLGTTTIQTQGISRKAGGIFEDKQESESENYQSRPLLFPNEVRTFDNNKLIMIQRAKDSVVLNKVQYKYWESNLAICKEKDVFELPKLNVEEFKFISPEKYLKDKEKESSIDLNEELENKFDTQEIEDDLEIETIEDDGFDEKYDLDFDKLEGKFTFNDNKEDAFDRGF